MKLYKENERVVYIGDTMENLSWGWVQFPKLYPMKNGNIGMYIHDDDPLQTTLTSENKFIFAMLELSKRIGLNCEE